MAARRTRRKRPGGALAGLALAWLGASCSPAREPDAAPAAALVRLALASEGTAPEPARLVAEIGPDEAEPSAAAESRRAPLRRAGGAGELLHLTGAGSSATLSLDPGRGAFNRVDVELSIKRGALQEGAALALRGLAQGRELFRALAAVPTESGVQVVAVQLDYGARRSGRPDELELAVRGVERWALGTVRLYEEDWRARLPSAGEPELVLARGERRRAVGLASTAPLAAEFAAPAGARLGFAAAVPAGLESGGAAPVLVCELLRAGVSVRSARVELGAAWRAAGIDLAGLAGERLAARFSLAPDGRLAVYCALAEPVLEQRARDAPSLLLVTSDTHRYDHLGAAQAGVELDTPALDRLAREGVFYAGCFAPANATNPSHAALLSGLHPRDTRVLNNATALAGEAVTLAELFRAAGFATYACVSVPHLDHPRSGLGQGFDRMSAPHDKQRDAELSLAALAAWLDESEGLPLFVWLHLFDAHPPYAPPGAFDRRYYPAGRDPCDPRLAALPARLLPPGMDALSDVEFARAQYRAEVAYLDHALADLLARPRFARGVTLFTADHGESLGEHDIWWSHGGLYPESLHVPLILRCPGAPAGTRVLEPVRLTDAGRTLLDLGGLADAPFEGRSLLEPLARAGAGGDPAVASEPRYAIATGGEEAAVHKGRWLLILCLAEHGIRGGPAHERHRHELYDLAADPGCQDDRLAAERETARELRADLVAWLGGARPAGWSRAVAQGPDERAELAALGYTAQIDGAPAGAAWFDGRCGCERCAALQ